MHYDPRAGERRRAKDEGRGRVLPDHGFNITYLSDSQTDGLFASSVPHTHSMHLLCAVIQCAVRPDSSQGWGPPIINRCLHCCFSLK